jgi:hypothetical protein
MSGEMGRGMSRARWLSTGAVLAALVTVTAVGAAVEPVPEAQERPEPVAEPVTGTVQVCPGAGEIIDVEADVAAVALDAVEVEGLAPGSLTLQTVPGADTEPAELAATQTRAETVTAAATGPVALRADGGLAPGVTGETVARAGSTRTSGLAGAACLEPGRDFWFAAGSGQVGQRATLVIANTADAPAVVDVTVWTEDGPVAAAGTQDLGIPPTGSREISIDAVASGSERTAVHVAVSLGRVGVFLALREVDGADPLGLTWVAPSEPPSRLAYVPGVPRFGERVLRLLNPGEQDAIVSLRAVAGAGPFTPVGLEAVDVPAGQVVDVDLEPAGDEAFAVEVSSTQPVVSAVRLRQTPGSGLSDIAVVGSTSALDTPAASRISVEDERSSRVVITALPDQVPDGGPGTATPSPTPDETTETTPESTREPTPEATPPATSPATTESTPQATPAQTPAESPAQSPAPSPGDDLVELSVATTDVVVRVVADDGTTLDSNVATLALGTTDTFPVDLPDDVERAWVVLEPADPGVVLAARETTTTVSVPDALDPDEEREAFWLDLVPLSSTTVTVTVPPVVADIRAGLPAQPSSS